MANTIKIKRRPQANGAGVPNNLSPGELAFSEADAKLYYGLGPDPTATPIEIGGSGYVLSKISENAPTKTGSGATGTWNISVTGNAGSVTNGVYTSRSLTAGSGLVGGGDLSANRAFDIGQGDGISVSADSIAVNNTVVRTTGNQVIDGSKTFIKQINAASGLIVNGGYNFDFQNVGSLFSIMLGDSGFTLFDSRILTGGNTVTHIRTNQLNFDGSLFEIDAGDMNYNYGPPYQGNYTPPLPFAVEKGIYPTTETVFVRTELIEDEQGNTIGSVNVYDNIVKYNTAVTSGVWRASTIEVDKGGTGRTSYSNGQLLIGSGNSLAANTLSSASGIGITNGSGTITIAVTGIPSSSITNFNSSVNDLIDDSVSTSIVAGSGATVVYSSGNNTLTISSPLTAGSGIALTHSNGNYTINNSRTGSTSVILSGSEYQRAALTGDVTASQNNNATTIANDAVTNAKAANMAANTIKGRITASTGDPEDLTASQVRTILNVADGANNYAHPTQTAITETNANGKVLSAISVNTLGHVTSVGTKTLADTDIPNLSTDKLTSGTLGVARGGIGTNTLTTNNILVGNGTNAISAPYSVETTLTGGSSAIPRADAVKTYVDNLLGANDAMVFKGTIGTGGTVTALPTTHQAGWAYRVITAGTYAGKVCEIGDLIIAVIDRSGSSNSNDDWTVVQTNIDGAVVGPVSSTDNALAVFNGATGKLIKNSSFVPTTVGGNLINLTDPGAIRFLRINANNTISTLSDSDFRTAIGAGTSSTVGTVTSVGGTGSVAGLTLTGTVTTNGNLTLGGTLSTPVSTINDSTAVGQNLVKLTNPSAIRFLRINVDNSVSTLSDSDFRTAIGAGTSSTVGTVTSVTAGSGMNFTGISSSGPVTLGTPSNITLSTANSLTSNSHTHAFAPGGTTTQYIRGDGVLATLCDGIANCTIDGGTF